MLTINGVRTAAKKLKMSNVKIIIKVKTTVSSLLKMRLKKLLKCSII